MVDVVGEPVECNEVQLDGVDSGNLPVEVIMALADVNLFMKRLSDRYVQLNHFNPTSLLIQG